MTRGAAVGRRLAALVLTGIVLTGIVAVGAPAEAREHAISGVVTNQNGEPMPRALVSLAPGNVEVVTGRDGRFEFVYLRDDIGGRVKLDKRQTYRLAVWKVGFHEIAFEVAYKSGPLEVEPVSIVPETLRVETNDTPVAELQRDDRLIGGPKEGE